MKICYLLPAGCLNYVCCNLRRLLTSQISVNVSCFTLFILTLPIPAYIDDS